MTASLSGGMVYAADLGSVAFGVGVRVPSEAYFSQSRNYLYIPNPICFDFLSGLYPSTVSKMQSLTESLGVVSHTVGSANDEVESVGYAVPSVGSIRLCLAEPRSSAVQFVEYVFLNFVQTEKRLFRFSLSNTEFDEIEGVGYAVPSA